MVSAELLPPVKALRNLSRTANAWGVLTVILGIVVLVWPGIPILVAAVLFGAYLVVSGIAQVASAFALDISAGSRALLFVSGALSLIMAVLAFRHFGEGYAVLFLAIWIAVGFTFQGVAETVLALSHPELPGRGWQVLSGVVALTAGMVTLAWPFQSIVVLATVTGVCLIVIGVSHIVGALGLRKGVKRVQDELEPATTT